MRRLTLLLAMSLVVGLAAGCGSDEPEAPSGANNDAFNTDEEEEGPELEIASSISLSGEVGEEIQESLTIGNVGDQELSVGFEVASEEDWLDFSPEELTVAAGEVGSVNVMATCPDEAGTYDASVTISSNDESADGSSLGVTLSCEADEVELEFGALTVEVVGLDDEISAEISVEGEGFVEMVRSTTTFDEVPIGDYEVFASAVEDGQGMTLEPVEARQMVTVETDATTEVTVTYEAPEVPVELGSVDVSITGLPADATTGSAPRIELIGEDNIGSYNIVGEGLIEDVEPGEYTVVAESVDIDDEPTFSAEDQTIEVVADETTAVEVEYTPEVGAADLSVEIEGLTGDADVHVAGGEIDETIVSSTDFPAVVPGEYTITPNDVEEDGVTYEAEEQTVDIEDGDAVTITVEYTPVLGTLELVVAGLDITGLAEADANITVTGDGFNEDVTTAGSTSFEVAPGDYSITVGDAQQGPATFVGDDTTATVASDATESVTIDYEVVLGHLHVDATGLPGGEDFAASISGPDFDEDITDATEFDDILPGEYTVEFDPVTVGSDNYVADPSSVDVTVESDATTEVDAEYGIEPGELEITVEIPDDLELELHVEEGGDSVHSFTADGPTVETVQLVPGSYVITTEVDTLEDEWGNEFSFEGLNVVVDIDSGDSRSRTVSTQSPTEVISEMDDENTFGTLREVVDRVNPESEITFADDVNEIALENRIRIEKPLSLIGHDDLVITQSSDSTVRLFWITFDGDDFDDNEVLIQDLSFEGAVADQTGGAFFIGGENMEVTFFATEFSDNESTAGGGGGAIRLNPSPNTTVHIQDSHFENNRSHGNGGAIRVWNEDEVDMTLEIHDSTFVENIAEDQGGGVWIHRYVDLTVRNTTFEGNEATNGDGGALRCGFGVNVVVSDVTFDGNIAGRDGGAIRTYGSDFTAIRVIASNNEAGARGGVARLAGGGVIAQSHFYNNSSDLHGGAIFAREQNEEFGSLALSRNLFEENSTEGSGGALFADQRGMRVFNSTFANNHANVGGAIRWRANARGFIEYSTMIGNTADTSGPAVYRDEAASALFFKANYVSDNGTTSDGNEVVAGGDSVIQGRGYNFINRIINDPEDHLDIESTDILNETAGYSSLADNGGPTKTFALHEGSNGHLDIPADECLSYTGAFYRNHDQRGEPRPSGGWCSRGAWEAEGFVENFTQADFSDQYESGSFDGIGGQSWNYTDVRDEGDYPVVGTRPGARFRDQGANVRTSSLNGVDGPIESLTVIYRKASHTAEIRQIEVLANGSVVKTGEEFGDEVGDDNTIRYLVIDDFDEGSDVDLQIRNKNGGDITIDQITWR